MYRMKVLETWEGGILFGLLEDKGKTFSKEEVKETIFEYLTYLLEYVEEKDEPVSVHISVAEKKITFEVKYQAYLTSVFKDEMCDAVVWEEI